MFKHKQLEDQLREIDDRLELVQARYDTVWEYAKSLGRSLDTLEQLVRLNSPNYR